MSTWGYEQETGCRRQHGCSTGTRPLNAPAIHDFLPGASAISSPVSFHAAGSSRTTCRVREVRRRLGTLGQGAGQGAARLSGHALQVTLHRQQHSGNTELPLRPAQEHLAVVQPAGRHSGEVVAVHENQPRHLVAAPPA